MSTGLLGVILIKIPVEFDRLGAQNLSGIMASMPQV